MDLRATEREMERLTLTMKHAATYHEKLALLRADDGESECDEDEVDGL